MSTGHSVVSIVLFALIALFPRISAGQDASIERMRIDHIDIVFREPQPKHPFRETQRKHPFREEELRREILSKFEGRELSDEDLADLCQRLTKKYVDAGYVTSGAAIDDQPVRYGTILVSIVEGGPPRLEISHARLLRDGYFRDRLAVSEREIFNRFDLLGRLERLHADPRIRRFDAVLKPGEQRGESVLDLDIREAFPVAFGVQFNNYQSPIVGALRVLGSAAIPGITGHGDEFQATYGYSSGVLPLLTALYSLPLTRRETTLTFSYRKNDFVVVDAAFERLGITSTSEIFSAGLRQPVWRSNGVSARHPSESRSGHTREFVLALDAEHERNASFLLGQPFSFSPGAVDGRYSISVLRAIQEFTISNPGEVFAIRSRVSFGIDALGSTIHRDTLPPDSFYPGARLPDSRFVSWLGQFQWSRRLSFLGIPQAEAVIRVDGQLANHDLLALEQLPIGGRFSVRGFRENEFVRDQGLVSSSELRIPVVRDRLWASRLEIVPFFDQGYGANRGATAEEGRSIGSFGIGSRWMTHFGQRLGWNPAFEIYWGFLRYHHSPSENGTFEDRGIHFQISLNGS